MPESPEKAKGKLSKSGATKKAKPKAKSATKPAARKPAAKPAVKAKVVPKAPAKVKKASPSPERAKRRVIKDVHRVAQTAALAKLLAAEKKRSQREKMIEMNKRRWEPDYKKLKVAAKYNLPYEGFVPGGRRPRAGGYGRYRASTFPDAKRDIEKIVEDKLKKAAAAKSSSSSSSSDMSRNEPIPFSGASAVVGKTLRSGSSLPAVPKSKPPPDYDPEDFPSQFMS